MVFSPNTLLAIGGAAGFTILLIAAIARWSTKENGIRALAIFLLAALFWSGAHIAAGSSAVLPHFSEMLIAISSTLLPLIFGGLTLAFLGAKTTLRWYSGIAVVIAAAWLGWYFNVGNVAQNIAAATASSAYATYFWGNRGLTNFIWGGVILFSLVMLLLSARKHPQWQYHNRYWYWAGGTIALAAAGAVSIWEPHLILATNLLTIAGVLTVGYTALNHYPPPMLHVFSRAVQSMIVALAVGVFIFLALSVAYLLTSWNVPSGWALVVMVSMAVGLGLLLPSLARATETAIDSVLYGNHNDELAIVKEYSRNVKTDWDFYKLSQQALHFVLQEIGVARGAIFIIHGDGTRRVTAMLAAGAGMYSPTSGFFAHDDPWFRHLKHEQTPISRYDLEMLAKFRGMDADSRAWLDALDADLFVPMILRQDELSGVLVLGAKPGHRSFSPRDLRRLDALVTQIALDLDKARLFGQLGSVNQKLGELSQEFSTLDQGKTDFISIASHELRTPLTHIHGYASMLLEATEKDLQDPQYLQHVFTGIARGSTRLKQVVDLIFDVSKADYGELDIARSMLSLSDVVQQAIDEQSEPLEKRGHSLIVSGIDQLPFVEGDMVRLVQAISQLLNNAIKYTPDGGTITITGRVWDGDSDDQQVEIIITDTGIGIDPADQQRIFSKFYRVDDVAHHSTSDVKFKGAGPGLGLPLVRGIAEAHGGKVWVNSTEYNEETCPGSQFHFVLPVKAPEPAATSNGVFESDDTGEVSLQATRRWTEEDIALIKEKIAQYRQQEEDAGADN